MADKKGETTRKTAQNNKINPKKAALRLQSLKNTAPIKTHFQFSLASFYVSSAHFTKSV